MIPEIPAWAALPATVLLIIGGLLTLVGSIGLLRLPNFFMRIHSVSMGNTLGVGCVLVASMLIATAVAESPVIHELLITLFVVFTAPITAIVLMQAAIRRTKPPRK
ncbi:monovalent cation/H(+) antiporter subunit G [Steroidobacter cummioxidans]|uniref:monovalent cation/H(+) antiporter subunit G n=1 Tax=Steroidobacter cummioxidans TaxID=1803913 RepID=UPI000E3119CA|nr:monovalent cation/H(+) antiporter subunit G [Steroidobacter cummioxidans]